MRVKRSIQNVVSGLSYEIINVVCSFILPRLILTHFGSDVNGLTLAVTQFLRMVYVLQLGLSAVIRAALYKPLAENDTETISVIIKTANVFLRRIAVIYIGIALVSAVVYPFSVIDNFDWLFTFGLILIMSLNTFANLYIAAGNGYLIMADHKNSVIYIINGITLILSTVICACLIHMGFGIHAVRLGGVLALCLNPVLVYLYVHKKYALIKKVKIDNSLIKQRWDNFAQELANFISFNTDLVIISIFTNVYEVSVYTVYMLVLNGVWGIIYPFMAGVEGAFGNMIAKNETHNLVRSFRVYEMLVFAAATVLYGVTLVMIIPFVMLYTQGVTDVSYNRAVFSMLAVAVNIVFCYRMPYILIINAAGHFKQTRNSAIIEMTVNIVLSITLAIKFGIIGVISATLFSCIFRAVYNAVYISRHIIRRSIFIFIKRVLLSLFGVAVIGIIGFWLGVGFEDLSHSFGIWIRNAALMTFIAAGVALVIEVLFYRGDIKILLELLGK